MAIFELPPGPYDAPMVDATRRITVPWKGWIVDWLALLQNAINNAIGALLPITGALDEALGDRMVTANTLALVGRETINLGPAKRGGHFIIEGRYTPTQIGAPVVAQLFPWRWDEAEGIVTSARAEVLDARRMKVYWSASSPLAGRAVLHFAIGGNA